MAKYRTVHINPDRFDRGQFKFYLLLLPLAAFMALPIVYIFFHALKPFDELFSYPPKFITLHPTLDNFVKLFKTTAASINPASLYLFNSIIVTAVVVVLSIFISSAAGFALSKAQFKGKKAILSINTFSLMFVPVTVMIPRFLVIANIGLLDNFLAHILPLLAMPVGLFLVKQFIDQMPTSLIEAARIDGASDYYILPHIVMPVIKPALATVAMLAFQASWNNLESSQFYMNEEYLKTFVNYMSSLTSQTGNTIAGQGIAAAAALIVFIPNIILFITMQSKVMNTMAHSGIK